MMHKAWCSIEEVPYYFSGSSIKFRGHTGWKIDDSNPIWVRLLGRSQLSNPSDLPCSQCSCHCIIMKFSGVITNDKSDVRAKGQGHRSKVNVTKAVFTKIIGHVGHFRWLGPNVWWEISQIWIEYIKSIGQMSDEPWKFFMNTDRGHNPT